MGYGRMGAVIAHELNQNGQNFVVVENNSIKAEKIIEN